MNISNRQISAFLAAARLSSFTRAADQLHVTQAGLSAIVRELETQFGCRLFERTTRSVSLTREGRALLPFAERILDDLNQAQSAVLATNASIKRTLTIAATPIVAATLIPHASQHFSQQHPGIDIRVKDVPQQEVQKLVESGEADVGFSVFIKPAASVATARVCNFRLLGIAPQGSLGAGKARARGSACALDALPALRLIALPSSMLIQQFIDTQIARAGLNLEPRTVCNSMQTILALVASGQGMALLPSMVMPVCRLYRLDVAAIESPEITIPFYKIARKGHQLHGAYAHFIKAMQASAQQLCAG